MCVTEPDVSFGPVFGRADDPRARIRESVVRACGGLEVFAQCPVFFLLEHCCTRDEQAWIALNTDELGNVWLPLPVVAARNAVAVLARADAVATDAAWIGQVADVRRACFTGRHGTPSTSMVASAYCAIVHTCRLQLAAVAE